MPLLTNCCHELHFPADCSPARRCCGYVALALAAVALVLLLSLFSCVHAWQMHVMFWVRQSKWAQLHAPFSCVGTLHTWAPTTSTAVGVRFVGWLLALCCSGFAVCLHVRAEVVLAQRQRMPAVQESMEAHSVPYM